MSASESTRPGRTTGSSVRMSLRSGVVLAVVSAVGVFAFVWPFAQAPGGPALVAHNSDAPFLLVLLMPLLMLVLVAELTSGALDAKSVALLGVLTAAGSALRMPTGGIAGLELVFFLLIPSGRVFGRGFGFVLGAVTLFASALLTAGVGPWLPFQMLAAGWVGFGAGCLPLARGRREILLLGGYTVAASYLYGAVMDLWFWPFGSDTGVGLGFVQGDSVAANLRRFLAFHATTALGWDSARAVSLTVAVGLLGRPVLAALRRAHVRASFDQPMRFAGPATQPVAVPTAGPITEPGAEAKGHHDSARS